MAQEKIKVTCECKRRFRANSSLAGTTVHCPHCESPIAVPALPADSYELRHDDSDHSPTDAANSSDNALRDWGACPECTGPLLKDAVICDNCGYNKRTSTTQKASAVAADFKFWHRLVPVVLIATVIAGFLQTQFAGVQFLWFFGFLGICGAATTIGAEFHDIGKVRSFVLCVVAFELLGGIRILYGLSIGMKKFEFLTIMMMVMPVLGALGIFGKSNGDSDSGWFFSSGCGGGCGSSCGSSCGGGCGGGGCGGCGG